MKTPFSLLLALFLATSGFSQEIQKQLRSFDRIVVSPKINLVLIQGNEESVKVVYSGVDENRIIIDQSGKRVHIYLYDAKIVDKGEKRDNMFDRREMYRYATVTAYVTFRNLRLIESRGEEEVYCEGSISSKKLKIRGYGETEIRIASIEAKDLKIRLYGENTLKIREGEAGHVSYKLYGENKVDSRGLHSATTNTTIFGEGRVAVHVSDEMRLNSLGEPVLFITGSPLITKGIIIGNTSIRTN